MAKNNKKRALKPGTLKRLLGYVFSHYRVHMIAVTICIILSAVSSTAATIFLQKLIDDCITPGLKKGWNAVYIDVYKMIGAMAAIYLVGVVTSFIYTRVMAVVTQGTLRNFRNDMFNKMQTLPIRFFDTHANGDVMSTYTNDTDAVRQMIGQSIPMMVQSFITVCTIVIMMCTFSLYLFIIVAAIMILMINVAGKFSGDSARYMMAQQRELAKEEGFIEEMMAGQKVVKVFVHEQKSIEEFDEINKSLFKASERANKAGNSIMPVLANIGNFLYVIVAIFGAVMVFNNVGNFSLQGAGKMTAGILISFLGMSRHLSQVIGQMSMQVPLIAMGLAGAERVFELMDQEPEEDNGYVTLVNVKKNDKGEIEESVKQTGEWAFKHPHSADGTVTYTPLKGDVRLTEVDFSYVPGKTVLHDLTLYAEPGQKIAFVGATGAGKTTITNLINRFYDIPDGKIRYDGININKIKKSDLRHSMAVVLQEVNLFTGTVMDNIRYGRLDATDEECIEAAKLANADDFITRLPDGYDTKLTGNGSELSQGQRQLISIARAAVANPPVMILDEATSSIDTRTEALVSKGMDNLMKGRTVFVIAHRLSTVRNADAIMVLDHGRIIERGTHDDLINQKGVYYQLYTGAFELE